MGLFGKKRPDDEDEDEVQTRANDLMASSRVKPPPVPPPQESSDLPARAQATPAKHSEAKTVGAPVMSGRPPTLAPSAPMLPFGIEEAVVLVRQLPTRNTELVMQVVKKTLESVRVDVAQIIDGATKKEQLIEDRITTLRKEIEKLEAQIAAAKKEIGQLEGEQREVTSVKERLVQAQKQESSEPTSDRPVPIERERAQAKPAVSTPPPPPAVSTPPQPAKPIEAAVAKSAVDGPAAATPATPKS